jgi:cell cycle sensor histidine kinase DivJ
MSRVGVPDGADRGERAPDRRRIYAFIKRGDAKVVGKKDRSAKRMDDGWLALESLSTRTSGLRAALADLCDRLVSPTVIDGNERTVHKDALATLLVGPLTLAMVSWAVLPSQFGLSFTFAFTCAACVLGLAGALTIATSARLNRVLPIVLAGATVLVAVIVAAAGGLSSPSAAFVLLLPAEAWLLTRDRRAALLGAGAAGLALAAQSWVGPVLAVAPSGWHWLIPASYLAVLLPRLGKGFLPATPAVALDPAAIEEVVDGVVVRIGDTGEVLESGSAARRKLGVDPSLLTGNGLFERLHLADRVAFMCALSDLRAAPGFRTVEARIRVACADGAPLGDVYRPFVIDLSRGSERDETLGILRAADALAETRQELAAETRRQDSLESAKSRFLAAVSHELRTPLNSIIGFSDVLLHETFGSFDNPRQKEYVELVRGSGQHLLEVVNAILDVSKIESGTYSTHPEPFRFAEAVDFCKAMLQTQADAKAIKVDLAGMSEIGEVVADRRAIQQILINLVSNAIKFTPREGHVTIGARRTGSRLAFFVRDDGIGIAEDDIQRLGRPFAQVHNDYTRQFEGTGLGLAMVRGLVDLHDGEMHLDSVLGKGTTVTVTLHVDGPAQAREKSASMVELHRETGQRGALRKAG